MERKNYKISQEVLKFPYNGNCENNDNEIFSEKFCCCITKIRKKTIEGIKLSIFYLDVSLSFANGVIPYRAVGFQVFHRSAPFLTFTQTVSEKVKIAPLT